MARWFPQLNLPVCMLRAVSRRVYTQYEVSSLIVFLFFCPRVFQSFLNNFPTDRLFLFAWFWTLTHSQVAENGERNRAANWCLNQTSEHAPRHQRPVASHERSCHCPILRRVWCYRRWQNKVFTEGGIVCGACIRSVRAKAQTFSMIPPSIIVCIIYYHFLQVKFVWLCMKWAMHWIAVKGLQGRFPDEAYCLLCAIFVLCAQCRLAEERLDALDERIAALDEHFTMERVITSDISS